MGTGNPSSALSRAALSKTLHSGTSDRNWASGFRNQDSVPWGFAVRTAGPHNLVDRRCSMLDPDRHHCFQEEQQEQDLTGATMSVDVNLIFKISYTILYTISYTIL